MTLHAIPGQKTRNVTGRETCELCVDGWVELAGTIRVGGIEYTRGWAPCKWCELGMKRYVRATEPAKDAKDPHRRWEPETRFDRGDVIPHNEPHGRPERDAVHKAQMKVVPTDAFDMDEVAAKQRLAAEQLELEQKGRADHDHHHRDPAS